MWSENHLNSKKILAKSCGEFLGHPKLTMNSHFCSGRISAALTLLDQQPIRTATKNTWNFSFGYFERCKGGINIDH